MKGVILQLAPKAKLIDITHEIEPQNVLQAAFVLRRIWDWYPADTVHLVVVDPGVGSRRPMLAGRYAGQFVVAPDNGIVTLVHRELPLESLHFIDNRSLFLPRLSSTFHGRDVMGPVAARLASGTRIAEVGPRTDRVEVLPLARARHEPSHAIIGVVVFVDRFGNLVTNIRRDELVRAYRHRRNVQVYVGGRRIGPIRSYYQEVAPGEPLALVGSSELVEISVNRGSAADALAVGTGQTVEVK